MKPWTTKKILAAGLLVILLQIVIGHVTLDTWGTYHITHTIPATRIQQDRVTIQDAAWTAFVLGGIAFYILLLRVFIDFIREAGE